MNLKHTTLLLFFFCLLLWGDSLAAKEINPLIKSNNSNPIFQSVSDDFLQEFNEQNPLLINLILNTSSLSKQEKSSWLKLLRYMEEKERKQLQQILAEENTAEDRNETRDAPDIVSSSHRLTADVSKQERDFIIQTIMESESFQFANFSLLVYTYFKENLGLYLFLLLSFLLTSFLTKEKSNLKKNLLIFLLLLTLAGLTLTIRTTLLQNDLNTESLTGLTTIAGIALYLLILLLFRAYRQEAFPKLFILLIYVFLSKTALFLYLFNNIHNALFSIASMSSAMVIGWIVYTLDLYENDSWHNVVSAFLAGIASTDLTLTFVAFFDQFTLINEEYYYFIFGKFGIDPSPFSTVLGRAVFSLTVGLREELSKLILFFVFIHYSREHDEPYDSLLYCSFISLGFAVFENFIYSFEYGKNIMMKRLLFAVPAHFIFGVLMGYFVYIGHFVKTGYQKYSAYLLAILIPAFFHGAWDFMALTPETYGHIGTLFIYITGLMIAALSIWYLQKKSPFKGGSR